jgi:hypothetical protein
MNRNFLKIAAGAVIIVLLLIFSFINAGNDNVLKFNDRVIALLSEMSMAFEDYMMELDNYFSQTGINIELLEEETGKIRVITDKTKSDIENIKVPDHEICRQFHTAALDYVLSCIKFYDAFVVINQYIKTHNPAEVNDLDYVHGILNPLYTENKSIMSNLSAVQENMAVQFDFELH